MHSIGSETMRTRFTSRRPLRGIREGVAGGDCRSSGFQDRLQRLHVFNSVTTGDFENYIAPWMSCNMDRTTHHSESSRAAVSSAFPWEVRASRIGISTLSLRCLYIRSPAAVSMPRLWPSRSDGPELMKPTRWIYAEPCNFQLSRRWSPGRFRDGDSGKDRLDSVKTGQRVSGNQRREDRIRYDRC